MNKLCDATFFYFTQKFSLLSVFHATRSNRSFSKRKKNGIFYQVSYEKVDCKQFVLTL